MSASEGMNDGLLEPRERERGLGGEEGWREGAGRAEGKEQGELKGRSGESWRKG